MTAAVDMYEYLEVGVEVIDQLFQHRQVAVSGDEDGLSHRLRIERLALTPQVERVLSVRAVREISVSWNGLW